MRLLKKEIDLTCKICNVAYEKTQQLTTHIQRGHNMTLKEYYDTYMKADGEGVCSICGNPTKWLNKLRTGYNQYCSTTCQSQGNKRKRVVVDQPTVKKTVTVKAEEKPVVKPNIITPTVTVTQVDTQVPDVNEEKMLQKYDSQFLLAGDILTKYRNNNFVATCGICGKEYSIGLQTLNERLTSGSQLCTICNSNAPDPTIKKKLIADFIKSLGFNVLENVSDVIDSTLDIYVPEKNIAFEFDDMILHNELHIDKNYHVKKTNACEAIGIQLIHIYEDEWDFKQSIVKSRIKGLLGLNTKIYARKCELREVEYQQARDFLVNNHIQGSCVSKYNYALFNNDVMVALMTFGKSRFSDEFELLRYCSLQDVNVIGGAGKLFNTFMKNHPEITEITSFADRRWSIGNLYAQLGFDKETVTSCAYFYVVGDHRENRIKYQKHKLITRDGADPNSTEHQIMLDRQIYRIYDCGNLKYVYKRNK